MAESPSTSPPRAGGSPAWLNPATIKGAILIGAGLLFVLFPEGATPVVRYGIGLALVFFGISDFWSFIAGYDRRLPAYRFATALIAVGSGIIVMFWPTEARRIVELGLAAALILQGLNLISRALLDRGTDGEAGLIVRGVIYGGVGVAMFFAGDFILDTFLVAGAVAAMLIGAVMVYYGLGHTPEEAAALNAAGVIALIGAWLDDRELGDEKRDDVAETLYFEEPERAHKIASYAVMLLLSVTIASLAILQDSTAVVIGAMLIAPLMTPIMGTGAAIVNGWRERMFTSLALVALSIAAAIALAWAIASWTPALVPIANNGQIASRVSPTLLDMAIALAAGAAGAYATVDDRVSSSLPGVAIAVALVPPLSVVGVTLQAGLLDDALGAFLLFSTNFVSIVLASLVVFFVTGFSPVRRFIDERSGVVNVLSTVVIGGLLIMIPLGLSGAAIINTATGTETAHTAAQDWLDGWDYLDLGPVDLDGSVVEVNVSGTGGLPPIEELEAMLSENLGKDVTVEVEYFETVRYKYSSDAGLEVSEPAGTP